MHSLAGFIVRFLFLSAGLVCILSGVSDQIQQLGDGLGFTFRIDTLAIEEVLGFLKQVSDVGGEGLKGAFRGRVVRAFKDARVCIVSHHASSGVLAKSASVRASSRLA